MWKPCGPGGSPLSAVLIVAPPAPSEIVMVPSTSPVPVGVACLISARSSRARAGPDLPTAFRIGTFEVSYGGLAVLLAAGFALGYGAMRIWQRRGNILHN